MSRLPILPLLTAATLSSLIFSAQAEVIFDWKPDADHVEDGTLKAETGPAGKLQEKAVFDIDGLLELTGKQYVEFPAKAEKKIPAQAFTIEAEVRIDQPQRWGTIIASMQDNGAYERGWLLGHHGSQFCFKVSTGGPLIEVTAGSPFSPGQWAHLTGVFDGKNISLYVDGILAGKAPAPGRMARPEMATPFVLGTYKDKDELFPLHGRIRRARIHDSALPHSEIIKLAPKAFSFAVRPAVRYLSPSSAEILWEATESGPGLIAYGTTHKLGELIESESKSTRHRIVLNSLLPNTTYHYRIATRGPEGLIPGKIETFDTTLNTVPRDLSEVIPPSSIPALNEYVAQTVAQAGFARGFCLVLGLHDGAMMRELARSSGLTIIGVESDTAKASKIRQALHAEGIYGQRLSITTVEDLSTLPFTSCLANLIVSESSFADGTLPTSKEEIQRLLRPGGLAHLADKDSATLWTYSRPPLDGSGDWSHQYGNTANTSASGDPLGGAKATGDFSLQWIGRPGADFGIDRNPRMPAPLAVNGRLFHQGMNRMVALDSFNGQVLWSMEVPDLRRVNIPHDCGNWCADQDSLFVAIRDRAWALDADTGERTKTYRLTSQQRGSHDWGFIACNDQMIFGSSVPIGAQYKEFWGGARWFDKAGDPSATALVCSDNVFAYNKESEQGLWAYGRGQIINSTITIAENRMWFVESRPPGSTKAEGGRVAGKALWDHAHVVCLDTANGKVVWDQAFQKSDTVKDKSGFVQVAFGAHTSKGFLLVLSEGHTVKKANGKSGLSGHYRYVLFNDAQGALTWEQTTAWRTDNHGSHMSHPVIFSDRVYVEPTGVTLSDGKVLDHKFGPRVGCATVVGSGDSLFFRGISGCVTQWPLESKTPTAWSRIRPSCWLNFLPAQGMMLIPEGGGGCSCGGWMETSLGLIPNTLLQSP